MTGLVHQHGRRYTVLEHLCGFPDVMWKTFYIKSVINQVWGQEGLLLTKFFFCMFIL